MAITIKPKQAFGFLPARNCICDSNYCQPWLTTDSFILQGTANEATGTNLVNDGDFDASTNWLLTAGWTISGGKLHGVNVTPGNTAESIAPIGLQVGKMYLVQVSVTVTSQGSAGTGEGWYVVINSDFLQMPDSIPLGSGYNQSLNASWIYSPTVVGTDIVYFDTDENTIDFDVEYIRVYELSEVGVEVLSSGTVTDTITTFTGDNFLNYYFNGTLFMENGTLAGETNLLLESVTDVSAMWELYIDTWSSITSETGCLTARFFDVVFLENRIRNGEFLTGDFTYWTAGVGWTIVGGEACYSSGGGITSLSQIPKLLGGVIYTFTFNLSGASGGESVVVTYQINGGAPITASQVFNLFSIDLSGEATELLDVTINVQVNASTTTLCVDELQLTANQGDDLNETNCINIQTEHPCTILLYAINLDNAFGLDYTSGSLQHWLRVNGKIKYLGYPEDVEVFKFSDNSNQLMFASSEKEFEVIIGDAPEQIHDCISILRLHDIFEIDGLEYVRSGTYDINRRRSSDNSQAIFTVKEQEGVSSNYRCL